MSLSDDLILAILAMDSYNRGYDAGIADPDSAGVGNGLGLQNRQVGTASIIVDSEILRDAEGQPVYQTAGFYAIAYNTTFGTVVSYRGTDFGGITEIDPDVVLGCDWRAGALAIPSAA